MQKKRVMDRARTALPDEAGLHGRKTGTSAKTAHGSPPQSAPRCRKARHPPAPAAAPDGTAPTDPPSGAAAPSPGCGQNRRRMKFPPGRSPVCAAAAADDCPAGSIPAAAPRRAAARQIHTKPADPVDSCRNNTGSHSKAGTSQARPVEPPGRKGGAARPGLPSIRPAGRAGTGRTDRSYAAARRPLPPPRVRQETRLL